MRTRTVTRYRATVEYTTAYTRRRDTITVEATDVYAAKRAARTYIERLGTFVRVLSIQEETNHG